MLRHAVVTTLRRSLNCCSIIVLVFLGLLNSSCVSLTLLVQPALAKICLSVRARMAEFGQGRQKTNREGREREFLQQKKPAPKLQRNPLIFRESNLSRRWGLRRTAASSRRVQLAPHSSKSSTGGALRSGSTEPFCRCCPNIVGGVGLCYINCNKL